MLIHEAQTLTYNLLRQHGLHTWTVRMSNMKNTLGHCSYTKKEITLSRLFVSSSPSDEVKETILHEIAHALVGPKVKAHGLQWKLTALRIGVHNPKAKKRTNKTHSQMIEATRRPASYILRCPIHGIIGEARRMGKLMRYYTYRCRKCRTSGLRWERA